MDNFYYMIGVVVLSAPVLWMTIRAARARSMGCQMKDKVVVVTGGCSGLGSEIAGLSKNNGSKVAVLDVKDEGSSTLPLGTEMKYYKCNVSCKEEVEDVMRKIERDLGTPDILINCAAAPINKRPFYALSTDLFTETVNVNLLGAVYLIGTILPKMIGRKTSASVVNVSSVVAHLYPGGLSDYAVSKAGLSALHHCLDAEARYYGYDGHISFHLVEVGQMDTPLFSWIKPPNALLAPVLRPRRVAERVISAVGSGRGEVIRLPAYASWVCVYDVLPVRVQRCMRYLLGIDEALTYQESEK